MSKHYKLDAAALVNYRKIADAPEEIRRAFAFCIVIERCELAQEWNKATIVRRLMKVQAQQNRNKIYVVEGGLADADR